MRVPDRAGRGPPVACGVRAVGRPPQAVHHRHPSPGPGSPPGRPGGAARGPVGGDARPRLGPLSVRDLIHHPAGRCERRRRNPAVPDHPGARRGQGLHDGGRVGADAHRAQRRDGRAHPGPRAGVRRHDPPAAAVRVVRRGGGALCGGDRRVHAPGRDEGRCLRLVRADPRRGRVSPGRTNDPRGPAYRGDGPGRAGRRGAARMALLDARGAASRRPAHRGADVPPADRGDRRRPDRAGGGRPGSRGHDLLPGGLGVIPRYTSPEMAALWSPETKFATWLEIELLAAEAQARAGMVPEEAARRLRARARVGSVARIDEIEARETRHDVVAFLRVVGESVGDDARYLHLGLGSSDVVDTALSVLMVRAADLISASLGRLHRALAVLARAHRYTIMAGRTHGVHAEPVTFGLKAALWYAEVDRGLERLRRAREVIGVGKISGEVGTFAHTPPEVEAFVCERLGLKPAPASSQVIQRDRHAEYLAHLAVVAGTLEK